MGEVISYTKEAIDALIAEGGGGITDVELAEAVALLIPLVQKGAPFGVATLDGDGQIPPGQLPEGLGSFKVELTDVELGVVAAEGLIYTWFEVPTVCHRGLLSRFTVSSGEGVVFDVEIRDGDGSGVLWLAADGVSTLYDISTPVYIEGDVNSSLWVGIKNRGVIASMFTLQNLRVEAFA